MLFHQEHVVHFYNTGQHLVVMITSQLGPVVLYLVALTQCSNGILIDAMVQVQINIQTVSNVNSVELRLQNNVSSEMPQKLDVKHVLIPQFLKTIAFRAQEATL